MTAIAVAMVHLLGGLPQCGAPKERLPMPPIIPAARRSTSSDLGASRVDSGGNPRPWRFSVNDLSQVTTPQLNCCPTANLR